MSEQVNIEIAKKQIAALNDKNIEDYLSRVDESYVVESETLPGPVRGREAARKALEILFSAFPDLRSPNTSAPQTGAWRKCFVMANYVFSGWEGQRL